MNEVVIRDYWCAAFLAASGCPLKRIETMYSTRYVFDNTNYHADTLLGLWMSNTGQVNVTSYVRYLKQFRNYAMSNMQRNGERTNGNSTTVTLG